MDELILIFGMALVTYISRALPFFVSIKENRFIKYVPASIFSALVFSDILYDRNKFIVGIMLFVLTYKNRNLLVAFVFGVIVLYIFLLI